jgi:DNA-binding transcriptional MerR regulator
MRERNGLRIGELAKLAGVSPDSIRHYERVGVLPHPQRTSAGYRQFAPSSLDRLLSIRRALALGLSLKELSEIFSLRDSGEAPCRRVRFLARRKLHGVRQEIAELNRLRNHIEKVLRGWDRKLARTPKGERAELLESLKRLPIRPSSRRNLK